MSQTTYKDSGVDLELYEQAMQRLPKLMHRTFSPRVVPNDGGFAGCSSSTSNARCFNASMTSHLGVGHRWRRYEAEGRSAPRPARFGGDRPGGHVRQ